MSASWHAVGEGLNLNRSIEVTWSDRASPQFECRVREGNDVSTKRFSEQSEVDQWASTMGVDQWRIVQASRCFPQAAVLRMLFPDAPEMTILEGALVRLRNCEKLSDIAESLCVHPLALGSWLRGMSPNDECIPDFSKRR